MRIRSFSQTISCINIALYSAMAEGEKNRAEIYSHAIIRQYLLRLIGNGEEAEHEKLTRINIGNRMNGSTDFCNQRNIFLYGIAYHNDISTGLAIQIGFFRVNNSATHN